MRLRVAFYKLAGHELLMQFEYVHDALRERSETRSERGDMMISSMDQPEIARADHLFIPGRQRHNDHTKLFRQFRSDEERDEWIRRVRIGLTHYVQRRGRGIEIGERTRGPNRAEVLVL